MNVKKMSLAVCLSVGLLQAPAAKADPTGELLVVAFATGLTANTVDTISGVKAGGEIQFGRFGLNVFVGLATELGLDYLFPGAGEACKSVVRCTVSAFNIAGGPLPLLKVLCSKLPEINIRNLESLNMR